MINLTLTALRPQRLIVGRLTRWLRGLMPAPAAQPLLRPADLSDHLRRDLGFMSADVEPDA
jgi:hypothetical protein